jgi:hypothetical protein
VRARRAFRGGVALACLLALAGPAAACVNESGTNRHGQAIWRHDGMSADRLRATFTHAQSPEPAQSKWARSAIARARAKPDIANLNDLAVVLIRFGRPRDAIPLLLRLEQRAPGRYESATNLGTAYELVGDNAQAVHWIGEGIRRNPDSHDRSEWVHLRLLETKVAGGSAPLRSALGLDFGTALVPNKPGRLPAGNDGKPVSPYAFATGIAYQLQERTQFVKPRDPVVAALFYDWANMEMAVGSLEFADLAYEFAQTYGHPDAALIARRRGEIDRIIDKSNRFWNDKPSGRCETCEPPGSG